jgi:hypothetical protein
LAPAETSKLHGPQLIYVLGLPFSGSTLFALALGNDERFFNAGEISFIEHDFNPVRRCSCGEPLNSCAFWAPLAEELRQVRSPTLDLDGHGEPRELDPRGQNPFRRGSQASLANYAARHADFVRRLARCAGCRFIVDASKSAHRLQALSTYSDLPIRVIVLCRGSRDVLAARIKRARRRNRMYVQVLAPFFVAWLAYHLLQIQRTLRSFRSEEVVTVGFPEFLKCPEATERRLSEWLGEDVRLSIDGDRLSLDRVQHVFTGNTWMKTLKFEGEPLRVRHAPPDPLASFERLTFRLAYALIPILRNWDRSALQVR